jgi:hypothetical protein
VLGFAFDFADGSSYYAQKRNETFKRRHPGEWQLLSAQLATAAAAAAVTGAVTRGILLLCTHNCSLTMLLAAFQ